MKKLFSMMLVTMIFLVCMGGVSAEGETYTVERTQIGGSSQYGTVKAYRDGTCIWTYTTVETTLTELEPISDVYACGDTAYIVVDNILYALDAATGAIKWTVSDAGASNSCVFDAYGNIYLSGYYGPNIKIISKNGEVLYEEDDDAYYWVYDLKIQGNMLEIYYDSEDNGLKIMDISQYCKPQDMPVLLNGVKIPFDQPPKMIQDRVMVPIRSIFEAMGFVVSWDGNTQTAEAVKDNHKITVQINNTIISYTVDGVDGTYTCDVAPQIVSGRTLVPVRAVAESAGCYVDWNGETKTVIIEYEK